MGLYLRLELVLEEGLCRKDEILVIVVLGFFVRLGRVGFLFLGRGFRGDLEKIANFKELDFLGFRGALFLVLANKLRLRLRLRLRLFDFCVERGLFFAFLFTPNFSDKDGRCTKYSINAQN